MKHKTFLNLLILSETQLKTFWRSWLYFVVSHCVGDGDKTWNSGVIVAPTWDVQSLQPVNQLFPGVDAVAAAAVRQKNIYQRLTSFSRCHNGATTTENRGSADFQATPRNTKAYPFSCWSAELIWIPVLLAHLCSQRVWCCCLSCLTVCYSPHMAATSLTEALLSCFKEYSALYYKSGLFHDAELHIC